MDKVFYKNHIGDTLNLRGDGVFANYKALKDFALEVTNNALTSQSKSTSLTVVCLSRESANRLVNTLEKDSTKSIYGKFYINDWYIKVLYQGLTVVEEYADKIKLELSFHAADTLFTNETEYQLTAKQNSSSETINFPLNFPFNFGADALSASSVVNDELLPADFVLRFNAPVSSVDITIGGNSYIVNSAINSGETFVLDTAEKEVYKDTALGKSSLLGAASDDSYIFETISSGINSVVWSGDFNISLLLLSHRRTPPWI